MPIAAANPSPRLVGVTANPRDSSASTTVDELARIAGAACESATRIASYLSSSSRSSSR